MSYKSSIWIYISIVLIFIINLLILKIFQLSHSIQPLEKLLWNYFESDVFKIITISLLIPIFLSLIDKRFKIIENYKERKKEKQVEIIKNSIVNWNDYYSVINEVIHCFIDVNNKDIHNKNLVDILKKLNNFNSINLNLTLSWKSYFFVDDEIKDLIIFFDNLLNNVTKSVINYIKESNDINEITKLQNSLAIIHNILGNYTHSYGFQILLNIVELQENLLSHRELEKIKKNNNDLITDVKKQVIILKNLELKYNDMFSAVDLNLTDFNLKLKNVLKWMQKNLTRNVYPEEFQRLAKTSSEYNDFINLFYNISLDKRIYAINFPYSKNYIYHLTDHLSSAMVIKRLKNLL